MTRVLAINGSYRHDGVIDHLVGLLTTELVERGADVKVILLREYPIEFCLNCRECTQQLGAAPAQCARLDDMAELIEMIERADAFILASPTNFGSATALFKRFMERLAVYGYWPWGQVAPVYRKQGHRKKKAIVVSSCAAPGILGRWLFATTRQLKTTAKVIGAETVGVIVAGLATTAPRPILSSALVFKARKLAARVA